MKAKLVSLLFTAALLFVAVDGHAMPEDMFSDLELQNADGFYTVLTDIDGDEHMLDGVLRADTLERYEAAEYISSYETYYNGDVVIDVVLNDIVSDGNVILSADGAPMPNGYYAVEFMLSETENTKVFLTGLSDTNLQMVQDQLINAKIENSEFKLESLDFIDAEKTNKPDDGDDLLCWAGSAADMLQYTGWAAMAGEEFSNEDDLFDLFVNSFTDAASNQIFGIEWFFDGTCIYQGLDGWSQVRDYGNSGNYLPQYTFENLTDTIPVMGSIENMDEVAEALSSGCGVGLMLGWMTEDGVRNGGHAITTWGYIMDEDYAPGAFERYLALIVSDSDSDMPSEGDRRSAPNILSVLNLTPYGDGLSWKLEGYFDGSGVVESFITLEPYSEEVPYETDPDASMDRRKNADLTPEINMVSNDSLDMSTKFKTVYSGDKLYVDGLVENYGIVDYYGNISYKYELKRSDGYVERETEGNLNLPALEYRNTHIFYQPVEFDINGLAPGDYIISFGIATDDGAAEAYYYNNYCEYALKIVDEHIDADALGLAVSAEAGETSFEETTINLEYSGLEELERELGGREAEYVLYQAYLEGGEWTMWSEANRVKSAAELPESWFAYANGSQTKFKLAVHIIDDTLSPVSVESNAVDIIYSKPQVITDESNTGEYTKILRGEKNLADGELFAFKIQNLSSNNATLEVKAVVYARNVNGEEIELLSRAVTLTDIGEISEVISFDSWSQELRGTYDVYACAQSIDGSIRYTESRLGTIRIQEEVSFIVSTAEDVTDDCDGLVSLREAVAYLKEFGGEGDKITVDETVSEMAGMELSSPIIIDSEVVIELSGLSLQGYADSQLIKVTETGRLKLYEATLNMGYAQNGGGIENNGGSVEIDNCAVYACRADSRGGGIYSAGGSVTVKNTYLEGNTAGYGGAVCLDKSAELNVLNCSFMLNSSNGGAVYNNGGKAVIVRSTFVNNTASYSGGGGITSFGDTTLIGCIASLSGDIDIYRMSGNFDVLVCYLSGYGNGVYVDNTSVVGAGTDIFVCNSEQRVVYKYVSVGAMTQISPSVSPAALRGIYLKNSERDEVKYISYSADNSNWIETDIPSAFTDEEYLKDAFGSMVGEGLFGANGRADYDARIIDLSENGAAVYVPEYTESSLILRSSEYIGGTVADIQIYECELNAGTNIIEIENIEPGFIYTCMLWKSIEDMSPLCEPYYQFF